MIVSHQAITNNWLTPQQIESPKTLVLGSYNPFHNQENSVDYYYGRKSNYFWKTIATIQGFGENHFFDNGLRRKLEIMNNRFCCLDVINTIEFNSIDKEITKDYINNNVFSNFLDQKIFTSKTKHLNSRVNLVRSYNQNIIKILLDSKSINKVIHTMGMNRISMITTDPKEKRLKENGFKGFIDKIKDACEAKGIEFVNQSFSPSAYAVRNGNTNIEELTNFLRVNLSLNN